jgi:hypothetical protein
MTQTQLRIIHDLKGDRNANRILNDMEDYVDRFRNELEYVYYLNKEGREMVGCNTVRKKTANIEHFILRNQLWIHLGKPFTWENEVKITAEKTSVVCDAKFTKNGIPVFVEVDVSQSMTVNREKIKKYKKIKELTGENFHLVWITKLESRRKRLTELCEGLTGKIYTYNDIF